MNMIDDIGYIYIMTNPVMNGLVKIGYATDPEKRRKELSHASGVPADFVIYATYAVPVKLADKKVHALITTLNPNLKFNPKKEFFTMDPSDAFKILEALASIHGRTHKLFKYIDGVGIPMAQYHSDDDPDNDGEEEVELEEFSDTPVISNSLNIKFDSEILVKGGKSSSIYMRETLINANFISESCKVTLAKLNKDGKRFWANPNADFVGFDWCLVLNDNVSRKLYFFKIPKNTFSIKEMKTRVLQGKTLLDLEIVKQDNMFVCVASKINYTKWLVAETNY